VIIWVADPPVLRIIRHVTFYPTGCVAEGNYLSKEGA